MSFGIRRDSERRPLIAINTLSVPDARLGGGFTYLEHLLPRLIDAAPGAQFHLLVTKSNRRLFSVDHERVTQTILSDWCLRGFLRTVIERWWVSTWLRRIGVDLYFVPYGWLPKHPPCPTVWTFQNLLLLDSSSNALTTPRSRLHRVREQIRRRVISRVLLRKTIDADRIIAVSELAKRRLIAEYPDCRGRITVVHEGANDHFTPQADPEIDRRIMERYGLTQPYCLSVSTLMRHKRHDLLIRAFVEAKRRAQSPAILVIAGADWGGYQRTLEETVAEVSGDTFVHFLNHIPPADLPALYRRAMMFALFSSCEAFGLPALEAMACGCPTVVAATSGLAEVVADGGLLVDPNNSDDTISALSNLLMSPERRAALSHAGQLRAAQFSWPAAAQQTIAVFQELLNCRISGSNSDTLTKVRVTQCKALPITPAGAATCGCPRGLFNVPESGSPFSISFLLRQVMR